MANTKTTLPEGTVRRDGVAVIILDDEGDVLVGKRTGSHGEGTWGLPGGHIEAKDIVADPKLTMFNTAEREVGEETGLTIEANGMVYQTQDDFPKKHKYYNTHFIWGVRVVRDGSEELRLREPNKCKGWVWMSWAELQEMRENSQPNQKIFGPLYQLLELIEDVNSLRPPEMKA